VAPAYDRAAHEIGVALAERGLGLVYGGGNVGLMGFVADAVIGRGGKAVGVIPQALVDKELPGGSRRTRHDDYSDEEVYIRLGSKGYAIRRGISSD